LSLVQRTSIFDVLEADLVAEEKRKLEPHKNIRPGYSGLINKKDRARLTDTDIFSETE
jgi:hypothetical protein